MLHDIKHGKSQSWMKWVAFRRTPMSTREWLIYDHCARSFQRTISLPSRATETSMKQLQRVSLRSVTLSTCLHSYATCYSLPPRGGPRR